MRNVIFCGQINKILIYINSDFSSTKTSATDGYEITYTSNICEPIEPRSKVTISGKVFINQGVANSSLRLRYHLYSPIKYGMDREYGSGYASTSFGYPQTNKIDYSFSFTDINNYARAGITVRLGLYDTSKRIFLDYIDGHLSVKESRKIDIDNIYGDLEYEPCLSFNDEKIEERFNFSNFTHLLDLETYYRLDLSSISFFYDCYKKFEADSISLSFIDIDNLFPYIEEINGIKSVPLYIKEDNKEISFVFKNLYVIKNTLEMSVINRDGFIPTNYFYLPKNKINKLQGFKFIINMVNGGVSNISFDYEVEIGISHLLLGPCSDSMYCVVGGVVR